MSQELELPSVFSTPEKLFQDVEDLVWEHDITWLEAVMLYSEKKNVEVEAVAALISKNANFKDFIRKDAEDLHYLPKTTRLPGM